MGAVAPRAVLVTRPSDYDELLATHATRGQAAFFLSTRAQSIEELEERHAAWQRAMQAAARAIPSDWRTARVLRADLDRFVFEPHDVVVAIGQDGLVANLAKYLDGQPVIGLNPEPARFEGVLVKHAPECAAELLGAAAAGRVELEPRTLVRARLDDGQSLIALNEIFIGHRSHQSARYRLRVAGVEERQSSSGMIVTTGTGATGWARSIHRACKSDVALPHPVEDALAFFVREAYPSVGTSTDTVEGRIEAGETLEIISEMNAGGVVFGDGMEGDHMDFPWGCVARIDCARTRLNLVSA